jgi:hypothetical protein
MVTETLRPNIENIAIEESKTKTQVAIRPTEPSFLNIDLHEDSSHMLDTPRDSMED